MLQYALMGCSISPWASRDHPMSCSDSTTAALVGCCRDSPACKDQACSVSALTYDCELSLPCISLFQLPSEHLLQELAAVSDVITAEVTQACMHKSSVAWLDAPPS